MALKRWAVRQISGLLSDYLEGVTEQNVQTTLSLEVGVVEIRHVRVHPGLLADLHLDLLSSDVSVSARIPWRNLGSEPTVITVRDVWAEVRAEPPSARPRTVSEEGQALQRYRTARQRKIQSRVDAAREAALAASGEGVAERRSMFARLGHAALRQLQVRVDGFRTRIYQEHQSSPPMDLQCSRIALDEGGCSDHERRVVEVPEDVRRQPASLHKVLELVGLSLQLRVRPRDGEEGPVAWDDPSRQLLREHLADMQRALVENRHQDTMAAREQELLETKEMLQSCRGSVLPMLGPLSLDARLWHSSAGGVLWLCTQLQVDRSAAGLSLSPLVVQHVGRSLAWYASTVVVPAAAAIARRRSDAAATEVSARSLLELPSGPQYAELCLRRLRQSASSDDEARLQEIEDLAPVEWLCRWQIRSYEQFQAEQPEAEVPKRSGVLGWLAGRWRGRGAGESESPHSPEGGMDSSPSAQADDEEASDGDAMSQWDIEEPHRVEAVVILPHCTILSVSLAAGLQTGSCLLLEGGVDCRAAMNTSTSGTIAALMQAPWDCDVQVSLSSVAVCLDAEPLLLLQGDARERSFGGPPRQGSAASDEEFFDVQSDDEQDKAQAPLPTSAAMRCAVQCVCRGGAAAGARHASKSGLDAASDGAALPEWFLRIRLKQEPFRFTLAPESLHSALNIIVVVGRSLLAAQAAARRRLETDVAIPTDSDTAAQSSAAAPITDAAASSGSEAATTNGIAAPDEACIPSPRGSESAEFLELDLDLDVAAPVLRWSLLPEGAVTLSLGRLLFRTCSSLPPAVSLLGPERCSWRSFSCHFQLADTSITVHTQSRNACRVYDPSTLCLRAWRGSDDSGWRINASAESVRWSFTPIVLQLAGQLPWSFDYALSPLRASLADALASQVVLAPLQCSSGSDVGEVPAAAVPAASPRFLLQLSLDRTELVLGTDVPGAPSASLLFEGTGVEYSGYQDRADCTSQVANYALTYDNGPVVKCTKGGSLRIQNADRHISVDGGSTLIAVQWRESCVREVLSLAQDAWESLGVGHARVQSLLPVGESAGMVAKLWGRFVIKPIQARVQRRVASRWAELLPGSERDALVQSSSPFQRQPSADRSSPQPADISAEADEGGATAPELDADPEAWPTPRGRCSVEVRLTYEGLTAEFPLDHDGDSEVAGAEVKQPPMVQAEVKGASCVLRGFQSGDTVGSIFLDRMDIFWMGRRLLTPRGADKLLQVDIIRTAGAYTRTFWTASWAQVVLLFRQRDFDAMSAFLRASVSGALPQRPRGSASQGAQELPRPTDSLASCARDADGGLAPAPADAAGLAVPSPAARDMPARFRLDIGAPLVFLPTDGSVLRPPRGPVAGGGGELELNSASGEPGFRPDSWDGFLTFDFGHVAVVGGGADGVPGQYDLQLRGAHVLGATPAAEVHELLAPLTWSAVLKTAAPGPIEFHATSTLSNGCLVATGDDARCTDREDVDGVQEPIAHRLWLTRAHLTLLLDVLAENICYSGRTGYMMDIPGQAEDMSAKVSTESRASSKASSKSVGRGFRFSWRWPGELVWDVGFSEDAPLGRLRLLGGIFAFDTNAQRSIYDLHCSECSIVDTRKKSRNAVKTLLDIAGQPSVEPGFGVHVSIPADTESTTVVQLIRPAMHVFPQLVMDLITAGLSGWQHCTYRNDRRPGAEASAIPPVQAPPPRRQSSGPLGASLTVPERRGTRVQVNLTDGVFRIVEKWGEPSEHFEFAGSLFIHLLVHTEGIRIERFDLEGGALRLHSVRREPTTLCPCLEWIIRGEQRRIDDSFYMKRTTNYEFRSIILPPYAIRMSMRDHYAMMRSWMELISLDGETCEPSDETRSRDPFALELVENRLTLTCEVAIQGAEVQIMGEEGGHEWPGLKALARCPLFEVMVDTKQGVAPTINLFAKELDIELWAHNHRVGAWEPVVAPCSWRVSYHRQRKPDGGPRDLFLRTDIASMQPLNVVIGAPFIQLASSIFKEGASEIQYGHLLGGVNISGVFCKIEVESGEHCILGGESFIQSLDGLLKGRGRAGHALPHLKLSLIDHESAQECTVPLGREVCVLWETKVIGLLVCRIITLRPPLQLLMISSTVCVWNRTPSDLEVRFLSHSTGGGSADQPPSRFSAMRPAPAYRSVDAKVVNGELRAGEAAALLEGQARPVCSADGAMRLAAGQIFSAPPEAQLRQGQVVLQMRPSPEAAGGIDYDWSDPFFSVPSGVVDGAVTVCSKPPLGTRDALPSHWLHLRPCSNSAEDGWCTIDVQAPFTIVNACPCDVMCLLNPPMTRTKLGQDRDRFTFLPGMNLEVFVEDGLGGEVRIPQGGQAEVLPVCLDVNGHFHWSCNGKRFSKKAKRNTNCVHVFVNARQGEIQWQFSSAEMGSESRDQESLRVPSQSSLPVFDSIGEDLCLSLALRDSDGLQTEWSFPLQAVTSTRSAEETVEIAHRGMYLKLNTSRQGRELVIYSKWWFVNSTGLTAHLVQPGGGGIGKMHLVRSFGDRKVAFVPQIRNEAGDGVAYIQLNDEQPVEVRVPDVGGAQAVQLTPLHDCCIRVERVSMPQSARGVTCNLVSLLPSLLVYNRVGADLQVGFRQAGCLDASAVWVSNGRASTLWWASRTDQLVQVAARWRSAAGEVFYTAWSLPFAITESRIGAYPIALKCKTPVPFLMCVSIDQDSLILAVTVSGSDSAHKIINNHPDVVLDATMDGAADDQAFKFTVPSGETAVFAGRGPTPGSTSRLRLSVSAVDKQEERAVVFVDLGRTGVFRVPLAPSGDEHRPRASPGPKGTLTRRSTLRVHTIVSVSLRNRVAVVTVMPGVPEVGAAEPGAEHEDLREGQTDVNVGTVTVALMIEGGVSATPVASSAAVLSACSAAMTATPTTSGGSVRRRREVFTVSLEGLKLEVKQTGRRRDVDFLLRSIQVDLQTSARDVVLKSVATPFLTMHMQRDDITTLDTRLKQLSLHFGEVEVSVTGAALDQVRLLRRTLAPGSGGLALADALARASVPFHKLQLEPPQATSKLVLSHLAIGHAKIDVWCRLHLPDAHYLPKSLRDTIQFFGLGTNRLDVKGSQVKLPQQTLFSERHPCEGSVSTVMTKVSELYLPHIRACWRSLLQHSNIFLGGLLSRHTWAPRQRRAHKPLPPLCSVGPAGELRVGESQLAA